MANIDHGFDLRQLTVVFTRHDASCAAGVEGLEIGLVLGLFGGTAKGDDGKVLWRGLDCTAQQRQSKGNTATQGSGHDLFL
ncbi:hypothetical protein D3C72_2087820 [compost metagenome]